MVIEEQPSEMEMLYYCEYCLVGYESYRDASVCEKKCKKDMG